MSDEENTSRRKLSKRHILCAAFLLFLLLLLIAWWQRTQIADQFVQNKMSELEVETRYNIENVGIRTQRVTDLAIGPADNPDLTVEQLEVDLSITFSGVEVQWMRAKGVRLRGQMLEDGTLKLGELDKLLPEPSDEPFELPDIALDLEDTVVSLATPWGGVGAAIEGLGQLRGRFEGEVALSSPELSFGGCSLKGAAFNGAIDLETGSPKLTGPITAQLGTCTDGSLAVLRPVLDTEIQLNDRFERWVGSIGFAAASVGADGQTILQPAGDLAFEGGAERTNFDLALNDGGYRSDDLRIGAMILDGEGRVAFGGEGFSMAMRGDAEIARAKMGGDIVAGLDSATDSVRDTPLGPLLKQLGPAARRALAGFDAGGGFDFALPARGATKIDVTGFDIASFSGARLRQSGTLRLTHGASGWGIASPLQLALSGGGLPDARLTLRRAGRGWAGSMALSPYAAGDSRLAVSNLDFAGQPGGAWRFSGDAAVSGPLLDGRVDGLQLPLQGRWNGALLSMYDSCQQLRFDRLNISGFDISGQSLRICPDGGSIVAVGERTRVNLSVPGLSLKGATGGTPFELSSRQINFRLDEGLRARDVSVAVGPADGVTAFDIAAIDGRFDRQGLSGALSGASGEIANVPMLLSNIAGKWNYRGGALRLLGEMDFTDVEEEERFLPMQARDVVVDYENGTITAIGDIFEPTQGIRIAGADILHSLNSNEGRALIAVEGINFNPQFQPELLTPLTLGVVANVAGSVDGDGRIEWDNSNDGIRSTGIFGTDGLDLAAAFGPVRGLKTRLKFTDLLALETARGQVAAIDSINPGVAALGGLVTYNLRADQTVEIESGEWPFAGGVLTLEQTVWDLGEDKPRSLVFRVKGVEVDQFLAQFDFSNLSATGTFDGVLPMVFDQDGGRIVGGEMVSRGGGGNISYIGDLTYEDLSPYANFAFDALRSLDYSSLRLGLNGDLEGEIITIINFKGIKQGDGAKRNFITQQLAKIPVEFNLQVEAQFFQLMTSVRSFYDPEFLVERNLPLLLKRQQEQARELAQETVNENVEKAEQSVQPGESGGGL